MSQENPLTDDASMTREGVLGITVGFLAAITAKWNERHAGVEMATHEWYT